MFPLPQASRTLGGTGFVGNGVIWDSDTEGVSYNVYYSDTDMEAHAKAIAPIMKEMAPMMDGAPERKVLKGRCGRACAMHSLASPRLVAARRTTPRRCSPHDADAESRTQ